MALSTSFQILENGPRYAIAKATGIFDAPGDPDITGVLLFDMSPTGPFGWLTRGRMEFPGIHVHLVEIKFSVSQLAVRLQWEATAPEDILILGASDHWLLANERLGFAGLHPPVGLAGATGSILLTTLGASEGSCFTLITSFTKNIPNG